MMFAAASPAVAVLPRVEHAVTADKSALPSTACCGVITEFGVLDTL
jgi:hypothetical protein